MVWISHLLARFPIEWYRAAASIKEWSIDCTTETRLSANQSRIVPAYTIENDVGGVIGIVVVMMILWCTHCWFYKRVAIVPVVMVQFGWSRIVVDGGQGYG